jgi:RNA polymerase sigma-70 factor, ECF subfamily
MIRPLGLALRRLPPESEWLQLFHRGDRETLEGCYRDHFSRVERAIGPILDAVDRETVIQEVFSRLLASAELRRSFQGGSLGAWLATVARNQAIDHRRRLGREPATAADGLDTLSADWEPAAEARLLVERFCRDHLPPEWRSVFDTRFLRRLSQREAATELGLPRTTLAYREIRIRRLLKRFLLQEDQP